MDTMKDTKMQPAKDAVIEELRNRLEAAEKERDALRNEIACVKEVEFPRKAQAVADAWEGKCKRLEAERDALRAKIEQMEIGKREISEAHNVAKRRLSALAGENIALQAKIVEMERQKPVAWAATDETCSIVEALSFNQSRRFDTPLYALPGAKGEEK